MRGRARCCLARTGGKIVCRGRGELVADGAAAHCRGGRRSRPRAPTAHRSRRRLAQVGDGGRGRVAKSLLSPGRQRAGRRWPRKHWVGTGPRHGVRGRVAWCARRGERGQRVHGHVWSWGRRELHRSAPKCDPAADRNDIQPLLAAGGRASFLSQDGESAAITPTLTPWTRKTASTACSLRSQLCQS